MPGGEKEHREEWRRMKDRAVLLKTVEQRQVYPCSEGMIDSSLSQLNRERLGYVT
jgi:hypothetical protein